jgi:hypothetical protein
MQCKYHPDRRAEHFCSSCRVPLCEECAEETRPGEYYCFQCAMLVSVSAAGTTIKGKREKVAEHKAKAKKKRTPFHYFVMVCSVMILVMWGVILFGGQKAPAGAADLGSQPRVFLFLVDGALKRYAHYQGNQYPSQLADLVPQYLPLKKDDLSLLDRLNYVKDPSVGYRLSLAKPKPGDMNIIISPKGVRYDTVPGGAS